MKLVRWGNAGSERPGLIDSDGRVRDLSGLVDEIDGAMLSSDALARIAATDISGLPGLPSNTRLGPCVGNVGKIVCIGLNYRDHAREANLAEPMEPIIFSRLPAPSLARMIPLQLLRTRRR